MAQDPNAVGGDAAGAEISAEEAQGIYTKLTSQPHCSQANFFLNVYWNDIGDNKDTLFAMLSAFGGSGEDKCTITSIQFMKVLQDLESSHKLITDFPNDGPSISKKFESAGIKKKGEIPLLGALLAVFEKNLVDAVNLPATPCNAQVRAATKKLEDTKNQEESLVAQKAAIEKEIEDMNAAHASAIKVMKKREELQKVQTKLDDNGRKVQQSKDVKAAEKALKDAEAALVAENEKGTDATNWLKSQCESNHKKFFNFDL